MRRVKQFQLNPTHGATTAICGQNPVSKPHLTQDPSCGDNGIVTLLRNTLNILVLDGIRIFSDPLQYDSGLRRFPAFMQ